MKFRWLWYQRWRHYQKKEFLRALIANLDFQIILDRPLFLIPRKGKVIINGEYPTKVFLGVLSYDCTKQGVSNFREKFKGSQIAFGF